ncbi:MAG TPA: hypothetical protein VME42_18115 [Steroidobacteraceae bacterium]|nr:hypothetical protein [Steroidobacteraceae bacterium]
MRPLLAAVVLALPLQAAIAAPASAQTHPGAPPAAAARPAAGPAVAAADDSDAAARHAKRTGCLKQARAKKLVGAQRDAYVKGCVGPPP